MDALYRLANWIETTVKVLVVVLFVFMLGTVLLEVLARNLWFRVRGLDELARYSQIWLMFMVVSIAARHGELIGSDFVVRSLPEQFGSVVRIFGRVLMLVFLALLTYYAFELVDTMAQRGRRSANLRFPMYWVYLPIVLGSALMFFFLLVNLITGRSSSLDREGSAPDSTDDGRT